MLGYVGRNWLAGPVTPAARLTVRRALLACPISTSCRAFLD
jgi:hypothetical protein